MKIKAPLLVGLIIFLGVRFQSTVTDPRKDPKWYFLHPTYLSVVPPEDQTLEMVRQAVLANCTMAEYAAPALFAEVQKDPAVQKALRGCSSPTKERKVEKVRAAVLEFWRRRI